MNVVVPAAAALPLEADTSPSRRILLLGYDLYHSVGGGQSVYQRLIALRPGDTFYYFRRWEPEDTPRPGNTVTIPYRPIYHATPWALRGSNGHFIHIYLMCRNLAAAVARHSAVAGFDVVDTPDYNQTGLFIRAALEAEGIHVGTVALALHGTLSSALGAGWPTGQDDKTALAQLAAMESLQFRGADARYAISPSYVAQWQENAALGVNALDPLCIAGAIAPVLPASSGDPPDLVFIGRREKWKGPDLFLDIAWWVDRSLYGRLRLIGPDGPNRLGHSSAPILDAMARLRGLAPEYPGSLRRDEIDALLASRCLLVLPSRHDTFNLTALEAIRCGCPVLVSCHSGFADWLRTKLPDLDWLITDIDCSRTTARHAVSILQDYDMYRARLVAALQRNRLEPDEAALDELYRPDPVQDLEARQTIVDLTAHITLLLPLRRISGLGQMLRAGVMRIVAKAADRGGGMPPPLRSTIGTGVRALRKLAHLSRGGWRQRETREQLKVLSRRATGLSPRSILQINGARTDRALRQTMLSAGELSAAETEDRIRDLSSQVPNRLVDRVRLFRELQRLEHRTGRNLIAASYGLRLMRWLGNDVYGDLPFVTTTLEAEGFVREAAVAHAMFGSGRDGFDRCADLMTEAVERNRHKPDLPLAVLDDRRTAATPRVSVIVSMYDAAGKLPTLLAMLEQQTLVQRGELELVLVDSNSPGDERGVFTAFVARSDLPVVYARSERRETIQAAWNRGIRLARAPYLCFLGVDEGLHPDALRTLAVELDADPAVDWAMADSLVTAVDRNGVFDRDIMPYDRSGYRQDLVYLETCYLSWVGGLYRRSIHDRFGWYDESFRAAGDTEFKNRVLPHIRSVHVPRMLGVFNNYPEERTTQHPRAEIEDLRAWYLWRTPAGMDYAFGRRPADDAARLFADSLNYRKSYVDSMSTDFDLAASLAEHLAARPDSPAWTTVALRAANAALALVRDIDLMPDNVRSGPHGILAAAWVGARLWQAKRLAAVHARTLHLPAAPHNEIFNDNRYEQHWYSWSDR